MTIAPLNNPSFSEPQISTAVTAATDDINNSGGINGHPLRDVVCDDAFSPNGAARCATEAVQSHDAAVVGSVEVFPNVLPILKAGNVPLIGDLTVSSPFATNSIAFPLDSTQYGLDIGDAAYAVSKGYRHISIIHCEIAGCVADNSSVVEGLALAGLKPVHDVLAQSGLPSYASAAAEATAGNIDAVIVKGYPSDMPKIITALRQSDFKGAIFSDADVLPQTSVTTLGSLANGLYLTGDYVPTTSTSNATVTLFDKEMKAVNSSATRDEVALRSWLAIRFFADLLKQDGLKTPTSAQVLSSLNDLSTAVPLGALSAYRVVNATPLLSTTPRVLNSTVVFDTVTNGTITQVGGFNDPISLLKSAGS
jgi:branched-chain amino acid transport system substrate-binding protein